MSRLTGRATAPSAVATPLAEVIRCTPVRTSMPRSASSSRRTYVGDLRADVGVQADGREALVLAVLRQHLRRDREERLGELLAHDLGDPRLVLGVEEREQEADGDRLDPGLLQPAHLRPRLLLVERDEDGAVLRDPLRHGQPVAAADDRVALPRQILVVREVERLLVPGDVEDVAVALGRDQPDPRAVVLDHDVGRDRRAVEDLVERGRRSRPPARPAPRCRCTVPCDGSPGVVGILWTRIFPASSST